MKNGGEVAYPLPTKMIERPVRLDANHEAKINNALAVVADSLWYLGQPDITRKVAMEIPLVNGGGVKNMQQWNRYNSLSMAYQKSANSELTGLTFVTPQIYDSIQLASMMEDCWEMETFDNGTHLSILGNKEVLGILNSKLAHNPKVAEFIEESPYIMDKDFPLAVANVLSSLSHKRTDARVFHAKDSETTITRAEGPQSIDYSLSRRIKGNFDSVYNHGFSVDNDTKRISDKFSRLVLSGSIDWIDERTTEIGSKGVSSTQGSDVYKQAIKDVLERHPVPIIQDIDLD